MQNSSKRDIFDRWISIKSSPKALKFVSPPYFSGEFNCVGCSAPCVSVCDRDLLEFDDDRVRFDVTKSGCNFCKKCAMACNRDVLDLKFSEIIEANTRINPNLCLAWDGVICYSCQDICSFKAIEYFGSFRPIINDKCVNCAQCVSRCFKGAITLS